jgi:hypothetical protein
MSFDSEHYEHKCKEMSRKALQNNWVNYTQQTDVQTIDRFASLDTEDSPLHDVVHALDIYEPDALLLS